MPTAGIQAATTGTAGAQRELISTYLDGLAASMYGRKSEGPIFEPRVGPSLDIEYFYQEILSKSPELESGL
ncbi:unnamed protein product, partial [Brenthis ino]